MRPTAIKLTAALTVLAFAGGIATEASAATARHIYGKGHRYSGHHYRHYGRGANVGPAVAGAALGIIGLAAGAAAAHNAYDDYGYGYEPGYAYGGYAPAPYGYNGYGYGYQPF